MVYLSIELGKFLCLQYLDEDEVIISIKAAFQYAYGQLPHVKIVEIK